MSRADSKQVSANLAAENKRRHTAVAPFALGEIVLCARDGDNDWDCHNAMCWRTTITAVVGPGEACESGWLYTVAAAEDHEELTLDAGWLRKVPDGK